MFHFILIFFVVEIVEMKWINGRLCTRVSDDNCDPNRALTFRSSFQLMFPSCFLFLPADEDGIRVTLSPPALRRTIFVFITRIFLLTRRVFVCLIQSTGNFLLYQLY